MNEYRCTLPSLYPEGCIGFKNASARQGHYVMANSLEEAIAEVGMDQFKRFGRYVRVEGTLWKTHKEVVG